MSATIPALLLHASRETLVSLLQQEDPNGCYTDELGAVEGFDPITKDEAVAHIMETEELLPWILEHLTCDECGESHDDCCCVAFVREPFTN